MSDIQDPLDFTPQPPYPVNLPAEMSDVPFDQLPVGWQTRIVMAINRERRTTGTSTDSGGPDNPV